VQHQAPAETTITADRILLNNNTMGICRCLNFILYTVSGIVNALRRIWAVSNDAEMAPIKSFVGGEVDIIEGRESLAEVTLRQYVDDENTKLGYCFLRVLKYEDQVEFVARLTDSEMLESYKRRAIQLHTWIHIMRKIQRETTYIVYRRCYYGEHTGSMNFVERKSDFVVPMWTFMRSTRSSILEEMWATFRVLTFTEEIVRLLVDDNHIRKINLGFGESVEFSQSRWQNYSVTMKNEYVRG
jgi:hypothetical protein